MAGESNKIALVFADAKDTARVVTWPCKISVPADGGKAHVQEIDARFTIPTPKEQTEAALFGSAGELQMLEKHLKGFPGLKDETGADIPFDKAKEVLFARSYVVNGLVLGLVAMARGRPEKN